jgi:predicted DNA-binding mobile mystery protein A
MSLSNLAKASGLSIATVAKMEKREIEGRITIESLRKLADAAGCDLVYAIVPRKKIAVLLRERAMVKAEALLRNADVQMTLEDQQVQGSLKARIRRLADQLVAEGNVW